MLNLEAIGEDLDKHGLGSWRKQLMALLIERTSPGAHGDLGKWIAAIDALPAATNPCLTGRTDRIEIRGPHLERADVEAVNAALMQLRPWRKGPFNIGQFEIDAEWRSDQKWDRLAPHLQDISGRRVLDVGCGNGYYALRMHLAGAAHVIGIDPTLLFVAQFAALQKLSAVEDVCVLPLRMEELPLEDAFFDTTFSMGVLYHRRNPWSHLSELRNSLRSGGELVLETLILPGDDESVLEPAGRYARMRNVWHLPTIAALKSWLTEAGFDGIRVADVTATTTSEQRTTAWMPFESLAEALHPSNAALTIEGLPAPTRVLIICEKASGA